MGTFTNILRGLVSGVDQAGGNTQGAAELQGQIEASRQAKQKDMQSRIVPHGIAIQGLRQKLSTLDPKENATDYNSTVDEIQNHIHAMREILHPDAKLGAGDWLKTHTTDRLHITNHDAREKDLAAKQATSNAQDSESAKAIAQGSPAPVNPYIQQEKQLGQAGFTPEEGHQAVASRVGILPKGEQEVFIQDYIKRNPTKNREDALRAYTDATTKDTAASKLQEPKPLETGGVLYGVSDPTTGKQYLASDIDKPDTPQSIKEIWKTVRAGQDQKKADADAKEEDRQKRFLDGLAAVASRQGRSEEFQAQMVGFREGMGEYKTASTKADNTKTLADTYKAMYAQPGNHSATDTALLTDYTSVLAAGGRKTQAEINMARKIGSFELNTEQWIKKAATGELPDELRKMYLDYIDSAAKTQREEADKLKPELPALAGGPQGPKTQSLRDTQSSAQSKGVVSIADAMKKPKYAKMTKDQVKQAITDAGYTPVEP
jgi:hypothetical protein